MNQNGWNKRLSWGDREWSSDHAWSENPLAFLDFKWLHSGLEQPIILLVSFLAPLTHASFASCFPHALRCAHSFACSLTHSQARGKVNVDVSKWPNFAPEWLVKCWTRFESSSRLDRAWNQKLLGISGNRFLRIFQWFFDRRLREPLKWRFEVVSSRGQISQPPLKSSAREIARLGDWFRFSISFTCLYSEGQVK